MDTTTTKTCCLCKTAKPLDEFYRAASQPHGRNSWCKACFKDKHNSYRRANPNLGRDYAYRTKFGITLEEYNAKFAAQDGRCSICHRHQSELKERLSVDHNHLTGSLRDLLCGSCNRGLGMFRENADLLDAAIGYLIRHEGNR